MTSLGKSGKPSGFRERNLGIRRPASIPIPFYALRPPPRGIFLKVRRSAMAYWLRPSSAALGIAGVNSALLSLARTFAL